MADEVLRLRTVVVADQALAEMRGLAREIGLLPQQARRGVQQTNRELETLGATIKRVGGELRKAIPGLSGFSLSAAGIALATRQLTSGFEDVAKSIVVLGHASRELGLTTQQIRGFMTVAEKAGIAPQAMMQGMAAFRKNTEDFKLRIGSLREEMADVGFGRLVERIKQSSTEMEAFKQAWDMAEVMGRNSIASKRLFEMLGIGPEKLRFSFEEFKAEQERHPIISAKEEADAKRYNDLMINIGTSLQNIKQREVLKFFGKLEEDKATIEWFVNKFKELEGLTDRIRQKVQQPPGPGGGMQLPPSMFKGRGRKSVPQFQHGGVFGGAQRSAAGDDLLRGSQNTLVVATREGTFQALLEFANYQQSGAGAGAGASGEGGGGAAGTGGGALGGGSLSGGAPSGGRVPSGQTPSDDAMAGQVPGQGSGTPSGTPGTPGGAPGVQAGERQEALRTVRGSVFGSTHGFRDASEPPGKLTASGLKNDTPGIALPSRSGLGQMHEVIAPDGKRYMLPQTDVGPAARTGRGIDINSAAANLMGYNEKNFPTDKNFQVGRAGPARPYKYGQVDTSGTGPIADKVAEPSSVTPSENEKATGAPVGTPQPAQPVVPQARGSNPNSIYGGTVKELQGQQASIRKGAIAPPVRNALDYASAQTGLTAEVGSGGQPAHGRKDIDRTGSHRHDMGMAADFKLRDERGNLVAINDPRAIAFYRAAGRAGMGGGGAAPQYMGMYTTHLDPGHLGGVYHGSPEFRGAVAGGYAEFKQKGMPPAPTRRLDMANDALSRPKAATGTVGVQVQHNGTKAKATAKTDGELFDKTTIKQQPAAQAESGAGT